MDMPYYFLHAIGKSVSTGYSTKMGIFHDNTYNPFNLGCDLMEPFRPLVDEVVMELKPKMVGKEEKERLINILNDKVYIAQKERTVMQAMEFTAEV